VVIGRVSTPPGNARLTVVSARAVWDNIASPAKPASPSKRRRVIMGILPSVFFF
jgi:hypothetical protein